MSSLRARKKNKNASSGVFSPDRTANSDRRHSHDDISSHLSRDGDHDIMYDVDQTGPASLPAEGTFLPTYTSSNDTTKLHAGGVKFITPRVEIKQNISKNNMPYSENTSSSPNSFMSIYTSCSSQVTAKGGSPAANPPTPSLTAGTPTNTASFTTSINSREATLSNSIDFQIQGNSGDESCNKNKQLTVVDRTNDSTKAPTNNANKTSKLKRNKNATEDQTHFKDSDVNWPYTADDKAENNTFWNEYITADMQGINSKDTLAKGSISNVHSSELDDDVYDHPEWDFLKHVNEPKEVGSFTPAKPKRTFDKNVAIHSNLKSNKPSFPSTENSAEKNGKSKAMPSRYYETAETLGDHVIEKGLVVKDVFPDGNCLFAAIVDQLRVRRDFTWTTKTLREAAVQYLNDNPYQADGTPLWQFLTEHDGTWDQYLARMRKEGEWGDHFVISALTNVLKRRIIIMRGYKKLTTTIMEPNLPIDPRPNLPIDPRRRQENNQGAIGPLHGADDGPVTEHSFEDKPERNERGVGSELQCDDLCIGHIAETHYVSLRHLDWEDKFIQYIDSFIKPSMVTELPDVHFDMLLKYLQTDFFFISHPAFSHGVDNKNTSGLILGDSSCGLNFILLNLEGRYSKKDGNKRKNEYIAQVTPNDTLVYTDGKTDPSEKDLMAVEVGCPLGYTKLCPVEPNRWFLATTQQSDGTYLRHLTLSSFGEDSRIGFVCSWPDWCLEYLTRERASGWPYPATLSKLEQNGVHVVAEASRASMNPGIEWKFSFKNAEKIICTSLGVNMKRCYFFLKCVCEHMFGDKMVLSNKHLKAVFFYTCEEIPRDVFSNRPGHCLLLMLNKLCNYLETGNLPGYFIADINLIAEMEEKNLKWHIEQLRKFQSHVLEYVFLILDRNGLLKWYGLDKCLDMLICDVPRYLFHKDTGTSFRECFIFVKILYIQTLVTNNKFHKIQSQYERLYQECTAYYESLNGPEYILHNVLEGLPIQEQWLFAFYMDYNIGSSLLYKVCRDRECTSLESLFGKQFINELVSASSQTHQLSVNIPTCVVYRENLVAFADLFTRILEEQVDLKVYKTAACFFLKENTKKILEDISAEELSGEYHTGHNKMKALLYTMFTSLYNVYNDDKECYKFKDLMEDYDLLSQHYCDTHLLGHVCSLWTHFGYSDRAREAMKRY